MTFLLTARGCWSGRSSKTSFPIESTSSALKHHYYCAVPLGGVGQTANNVLQLIQTLKSPL